MNLNLLSGAERARVVPLLTSTADFERCFNFRAVLSKMPQQQRVSGLCHRQT